MCVCRLCPSSTLPVGNLKSAAIVPSHRGAGRRPGYNTEHFGQSMSAEIKSHLTELLTRALAKVAPQQPGSLISLERTRLLRRDLGQRARKQLGEVRLDLGGH